MSSPNVVQIPLSIAASQQRIRLLELPPEVLEIITKPELRHMYSPDVLKHLSKSEMEKEIQELGPVLPYLIQPWEIAYTY